MAANSLSPAAIDERLDGRGPAPSWRETRPGARICCVRGGGPSSGMFGTQMMVVLIGHGGGKPAHRRLLKSRGAKTAGVPT